MKISDHLVQMFMEDEWDDSILTRESFPVNIRLLKCNKNYRNIILEIIRIMDEHLHTNFEDYAQPRGVAAPAMGYPYRIIGFKKNQMFECQFCINPKITKVSPTVVNSTSNCGTLRLPENVEVERYGSISMEYYDLEGNLVTRDNIYRTDSGFTIQHEVDQINGITVVDRHQRDKKNKE